MSAENRKSIGCVVRLLAQINRSISILTLWEGLPFIPRWAEGPHSPSRSSCPDGEGRKSVDCLSFFSVLSSHSDWTSADALAGRYDSYPFSQWHGLDKYVNKKKVLNCGLPTELSKLSKQEWGWFSGVPFPPRRDAPWSFRPYTHLKDTTQLPEKFHLNGNI